MSIDQARYNHMFIMLARLMFDSNDKFWAKTWNNESRFAPSSQLIYAKQLKPLAPTPRAAWGYYVRQVVLTKRTQINERKSSMVRIDYSICFSVALAKREEALTSS